MKLKHLVLLVATICLIFLITGSFSQNLLQKDDNKQISVDSKVINLESKVAALELKVSSLEAKLDKLEDQISNPQPKVIPLNQ
jgi:peptidoglycan hydrolase CwlO-like protein